MMLWRDKPLVRCPAIGGNKGLKPLLFEKERLRFRPWIKSGAGSCLRLVYMSMVLTINRAYPDTLLIQIYCVDFTVYEKNAPSN